MNAHQLCAIKALPKSLIRGWLEEMASGVHERNSAPAPDMALSLGLGLRFHPVVLPGDVDSSSAFDAPSAEVCK